MAQESWNYETAEGSQPQDGLVLCSNNCGFFGCAATMNLCSKCYRDLIAKKQGGPSEITMLSSNTSPVHIPTGGAEKSFSKSSFPLSLPASVEQIQQQMALPSAVATAEETSSALIQLANSPCCLPSVSGPSPADLPSVAALLSSDMSYSKTDQAPSRRQTSNRCLACNKRMGLLAFKCRCGNVFCASHRYSDKHGCPFDYKAAGREAIAKANPVVTAKKVERI